MIIMVEPERSSSQRRRTTTSIVSRRIRSFHALSFTLAAAAAVLLTAALIVETTTASALPALSMGVTPATKNAAAAADSPRSPSPYSKTAVLLASVSSSTVVAPTASSSSSSSSSLTAEALASAATTEASSSNKNKNAVVQLAVYLKDSVQRTILGVEQLYTNHGRCNEIRSKIKMHQSKVRMQWEQQGLYDDDTCKNNDAHRELDQKLKTITGGISYEDFVFLQKGKEDRSKVMTLAFIMFGAPKVFPYMLMFNQQMLPSPLVNAPQMASKGTGHGETLLETKSRERTAVILKMLLQLERDARVIPALSQVNIFGRKQQQERMERIASLNAQGMQFLQTIGVKSTHSSTMSPTQIASTSLSSSSKSDATAMDMSGGGGNHGARRLLNMLEPYLYQAGQDFDRASQRLSHVPASIVRGLGNAALGSGGMLDAFLPTIMARGRWLEHVKKVEAADDFIVHAKIDLTTISPRLLREACTDRLIGGPGCSSRELRLLLQEWLTMAVQVPEQRLKGGNSGTNKLFYNGNLARTALMGYYGLQAVQDSRCASALPRLVFTASGQQQQHHGGTSGDGSAAGMEVPSSSARRGGNGWRAWR
jgi:LETM1-like protein